MQRTFNAFILGSLLLLVTFIFSEARAANELTGPQVARIIVPKAIVYSDENMNSPLGYISMDKLISVGTPRKKNPDLVPLIVYGRVAFIEQRNIRYENDSLDQLNSKRGAPKEHNIDLILTKPEEKLSENNSAYLSLHQFYAGAETNQLFDAIDGTPKDNLLGFGLTFLHHPPTKRLFWGLGFEYSSISSTNVDFSISMVNMIFGHSLIKNPLFFLDLWGSVDFSTFTRLDIDNNYQDENAPFLYGPQIGGRAIFFPYQRYHVTGALSYKNYKVLKRDELVNEAGDPVNGISKVAGLVFAVGIAMEL